LMNISHHAGCHGTTADRLAPGETHPVRTVRHAEIIKTIKSIWSRKFLSSHHHQPFSQA